MHEEGCLKRFIVPGISFFSLLFYVLQISRILFVSDFFSGGGVLCVSSLPNRGKCPLSVRLLFYPEGENANRVTKHDFS
jgi:hypothetical protein